MTPSRLSAVFTLCILLFFATPAPAQAALRGDAAADMAGVINALRAARGLAAYTIDPRLMALAQAHSEYQAAIHQSTHLHSDGSAPPQLGVVENVAGGTLGAVTPEIVVYEIWVDAGHMKTMVGYSAGAMGVGVADDGETVYYTLEVVPVGSSGAAATNTPAGSAGAATAAAATTAAATTPPELLTPIPLVTLVTTTPQPDGAIYHLVGYGQTLWSIAMAYGVREEQIRAWNNMAVDANDIYAGQKLLVRPASLAPATATATSTPAPSPTLSPSPTSSPAAPVPATGGSLADPTPTAAAAPRIRLELNPEYLVPLIAMLSIFIGGTLLFFLVRARR